MQKVEPLLESRTQPMGPLEEGDQALVDAANQLPAGVHSKRGGAGRVRVFKQESPVQINVSAETTAPDGAMGRAGTLINKANNPESLTIVADMAAWTAEGVGRPIALVSDNRVQADEGKFITRVAMKEDRAKAQATKLEIAGKLDAAREHLGETSVEAATKE